MTTFYVLKLKNGSGYYAGYGLPGVRIPIDAVSWPTKKRAEVFAIDTMQLIEQKVYEVTEQVTELEITKPDVELILTAEEASTLLTILSHVGGYPATSPRGRVIEVQNKLHNLKVKPLQENITTGSIHFKDYPRG